jgi:hypothetical protein
MAQMAPAAVDIGYAYWRPKAVRNSPEPPT